MARRTPSLKSLRRIDPAATLRTLKASARSAASHLEKVFEERVTRAMARIGVPTRRDVRELSAQVAELQASVERLKRARARA